MVPESINEKLKKFGQEHVLKYYEELSDAGKNALIAQIEATDMSVLEAAKNPDELSKKGVISPLPCMELDEIKENRARFEETGIRAIKEGKVAAVLLAGGMGTRLGSDDPKECITSASRGRCTFLNAS